MSQPSRPRTRGPAERRRRTLSIDRVTLLEERQLLAPVLPLFPLTATLGTTTTTWEHDLAPVTITTGAGTASTTTAGFPSAAPLDSVALLSPNTQFGGDIVRIEAGPGGVHSATVSMPSREGPVRKRPVRSIAPA